MRRSVPLFILFLAWVGSASASVLRVPEDYATIYAAVDAAAAGDSVLVGPGTWTERDTRTVGFNGGLLLARAHAFLKPNLTIIGTAGADATILLGDAPGAYSNTILIHPDHPSGPTVIQGLTLRGQTSGYYRAVLSSGSGPLEFYDCVIESSTQGLVLWAADLKMRDCVVRDNDGTGVDTAGLWSAGNFTDWDLEGCMFEHNVGPNILKNQDQGRNSQTSIRNCRFVENSGGKMMLLIGQWPLMIQGSWIEGNTVSAGGSGFCFFLSDCEGSIQQNTFVNNVFTGPSAYGAIFVNGDFPVDLVSNTVVGTVTPPGSVCAGIGLQSFVPHDLGSNIIAGCRGGPAVQRTFLGYNPTAGCNVFWDNDSGDFDDYVPQPTDVIANPLFCDPENLDFTLSVLSPCLPGGVPGCGLIGAWDQGCGVISIEPRSWGQIKGLYRLED